MIKICDRLIAPNQSSFIKGRFILESVVAAHEAIHEVARKKKKKGLSLSLTMKKHMIGLTGISWKRC